MSVKLPRMDENIFISACHVKAQLTLWLLGVSFPEQERNRLGPDDTHLKAEHKHVCFLSDLNIWVVFKFAIHAHCFLGPAKERYSS